MSRPTLVMNLDVEINYSQVYIYSASPWASGDYDAVLRALDDAQLTGRFVGVANGVIDVVTPVQWNYNAPMRVEVWPTEPPADFNNWDQVVDVDFDVSDDQLTFEGAGGRPPIRCTEPVPSGAYRARVSGRGYAEASEGVEGMDDYRLQLWPRDHDREPQPRKRWSGWRE